MEKKPLNLTELFKRISFISLLNADKDNLKDWEYELLINAWFLFLENKATDDNFSQLIKDISMKYEKQLEEEIKGGNSNGE